MQLENKVTIVLNMFNCKLLLFYLSSFSFGARTSCAPIEFKWIEQKLDHVNDSDWRTFQMRYMIKEDYFQPNGTIFFFMGGEGTILSPATNVSEIILTKSFINDLARQFRGYLIHSEHRYYGESKPTRSLDLDSLKYLTAPQAMADVAALIRFLKANTTFFGESKVFLVGGSYSGFLVPWFAKLYPDLIDLGWGSGAPFQFTPALSGFYPKVQDILAKIGGFKCQEIVEEGFKNLKNYLIQQKPNNHLELGVGIFEAYFCEKLAGDFATLVQFGNKTSIKEACKNMAETSFNSYFKKQLNKISIEGYFSYLKTLRNHQYTTDSDRLWLYQCCNEFGNFQTSDCISLDFYQHICSDAFGNKFKKEFIFENVKRTDQVFEDLQSSESVRRIFLTQAELDAWSATEVRNHNLTYFLKDAAHCEDLQPLTKDNKPSILALKKDIYREVQRLQRT